MRVIITIFLLVACSAPTLAQLPDVEIGSVDVRLKRFTSGLPIERDVFNNAGPTDMAVVPQSDNRLVVTNYGGLAVLLEQDGRPTTFFDLSDESSPTYSSHFDVGDAHGLTSIAFHPQFAEMESPGYGKFYTLEAELPGSGVIDFAGSVRGTGHHDEVIYEYTLPDNSALFCDQLCAESKRPVLRVDQPGWHHNLGDLEFGPDGYLYVSAGDGNTSGTSPPFTSDNAQRLDNVYGKILRIDPLGSTSANGQYGVPSDNPFFDASGSLGEIFAYGLRNPYRIAFDQDSGVLFAADVGEVSVESVDVIVAGGNYGWDRMEGSFVYDPVTKLVSEDIDGDGDGRGDVAQANDFVGPVFQYDRDDGRSVIGGVLYRGEEVPALQGKYVFADFTGRLFFGDPNSRQMWELGLVADTDPLPDRILSVNADASGEIYILGTADNAEGEIEGVIVRLFGSTPGLRERADFDADGMLSVLDLDLLCLQVNVPEARPLFDLDGDGSVDPHDVAAFLEVARKLPGDADLNSQVDFNDFVVLANSYGSAGNWSDGDFDCSGMVDFSDFVVLANFYGKSFPISAAVAEPSGLCLAVGVMFLSGGLLRSRPNKRRERRSFV